MFGPKGESATTSDRSNSPLLHRPTYEELRQSHIRLGQNLVMALATDNGRRDLSQEELQAVLAHPFFKTQ